MSCIVIKALVRRTRSYAADTMRRGDSAEKVPCFGPGIGAIIFTFLIVWVHLSPPLSYFFSSCYSASSLSSLSLSLLTLSALSLLLQTYSNLYIYQPTRSSISFVFENHINSDKLITFASIIHWKMATCIYRSLAMQ